jgi:putative transposase
MHFVSYYTSDDHPLRMLVVLDELTAILGAPAHLRGDNRPEFVSAAVRTLCEEGGTGTLYIDPGPPSGNGIVQSFNGCLRDELLSSQIFDTLAEARLLVDR